MRFAHEQWAAATALVLSLGTADLADDVTTLITYGLETGFDLGSGDQPDGVLLSIIDPADLVDVAVTLPSAPTGLDQVQVFPYVDLGDEGSLVFSLPAITPATPSAALPAIEALVAGASYELRAVAEPSDGDGVGVEGTVAFLRASTLGDSLTFSDWLPRPTGVSAAEGVYQFTPVAGASLHSAQVEDSDGNPVWHVLLLDGRTSFSLPTVTPDPFPTGDATLFVSASVFPDFDPMDFSGDTLGDTVTHSSRTALLLSR